MAWRVGWSACVVAAMLVVGMLPNVAEACSCDPRHIGSFVREPDDHSPLNPRLWTESDRSDAPVMLELFDADGTAVPLDMSTIVAGEAARVTVFSPPELELEARYVLRVAGDGSDEPPSFFRAQDARDDEPPALPAEAHRSTVFHRAALSCDESATVTFVFEDDDAALIVADIDGTSALRADSLTGRVSAATFGNTIEVGYGDCQEGWPSEKRSATVRFAAFDIAGNFSGWTEPEEVSIDGCGCRSSRSGSTPAAVLVVLLVFVARRRTGDRAWRDVRGHPTRGRGPARIGARHPGRG